MRKHTSLLGILGSAFLLAAVGNSFAQNPAPATPKLSIQSTANLKEINLLIVDVQAQQKSIAANQALIDQKIATLAETIRTARIFSKRGGGAAK